MSGMHLNTYVVFVSATLHVEMVRIIMQSMRSTHSGLLIILGGSDQSTETTFLNKTRTEICQRNAMSVNFIDVPNDKL